LVWLGWVTATDARVPTLETIARAVAMAIPVGIVVGIGWSRLRRPQASELVVELRSEAAATMRERLARALGDPTLDVAYRLGDGAQQRLVTLSVALGLEASRADRAAAGALSRAQDEVEQAIGELRELARGIHPTLLRDEGLTAAVEALARRAPLPVTVQSSAQDRLP